MLKIRLQLYDETLLIIPVAKPELGYLRPGYHQDFPAALFVQAGNQGYCLGAFHMQNHISCELAFPSGFYVL